MNFHFLLFLFCFAFLRYFFIIYIIYSRNNVLIFIFIKTFQSLSTPTFFRCLSIRVTPSKWTLYLIFKGRLFSFRSPCLGISRFSTVHLLLALFSLCLSLYCTVQRLNSQLLCHQVHKPTLWSTRLLSRLKTHTINIFIISPNLCLYVWSNKPIT